MEADHVVVVRAHRGRVLILHAVLGVAIALAPASPDSSILGFIFVRLFRSDLPPTVKSVMA